MVAESIEILAPIDQFGWATACSGVAVGHLGERPVAERPAGRGQDEPLDRVALARVEHLEDRVVLGIDRQQRRRRLARPRRISSSPAQTRPPCWPAPPWRRAATAASVGARPAAPTIAAITHSAGRAAASTTASGPAAASIAGAGQRVLAARGSAAGRRSRPVCALSRRACSASASTGCRRPAPRRGSCSGARASRSTVLWPTEPVEPRIGDVARRVGRRRGPTHHAHGQSPAVSEPHQRRRPRARRSARRPGRAGRHGRG